MHENSRLLFQRHAAPHIESGARVLEIGPDAFPSTYSKLVQTVVGAWDTLDIYDSPNLTYPRSGEFEFPVASDSYDVVLSGQVIEHVKQPWRWLRELARVVRPGGKVITINPVSWPYHEAPVDCWRIYPEGMRALYASAGLAVEHCLHTSLERPGYSRYRPGMSHHSLGRLARWRNQLAGWIGLPVERAYDTITVGRKPGAGLGDIPATR